MSAEKDVINFNVNDKNIAEVKEQFKEVDAYQDLEAAKQAKKVLTKMRTTLADAHKEAKADALAYGRKLDAEKNRLLGLIAEIEDPITRQLDAIRNKAIQDEENRLNAIHSAIADIQEHAEARHSMTLDELKATREKVLAIELDPAVFQEFAEAAQLAKDETALKLRLAIERETDRLAEEAKNEKIRLENEALKKQLAEAQAAAEAAAAEQRAKEQLEIKRAQAEREEAERKARAEHDAKIAKERAELAEKQRLIDAENARIERERQEKAAQEEAARLAAERLARAPDVEKLEHYASQIDQLIKAKPELSSDAGNEAMLQAISVLIEVAFDIRKATEEMK